MDEQEKDLRAPAARTTVLAASEIKALLGVNRDHWFNDLDVDVRLRDDGVAEVRLRTMYEFVNLTFADMEKVAEVLGTKEINVEYDSSPGCESCDYGSQYDLTLYAKNAMLRDEPEASAAQPPPEASRK